MDEPLAYTNSQDSPQFRLGGSHHLPLIIFSMHGLHPNVILFQDSQLGRLEIHEIGTPTTLEAYNFFSKPPIEVRFKAKLYPLLRAFQ
jgi:hypothetical protein